MYTNHRHYILFILAFGSIAIAILGYVFLYIAVQSQSIQAHQAMTEMAVTDEKKKHEEDTVSIFNKTADIRVRLDSAILTQGKIVDFIKALEKVGTDTGTQFDLSGITDEPIPTQPLFSYFKGRVEIKGTWADTVRALTLIEHMPYSISLNNIRLAEVTDVQVKPVKPGKVWGLTLDLKVLSRK